MTPTHHSQKKQQGVALIIVLFIVALVATIAAQMSVNLMLQIEKTSNTQDYRQAKWYGYAAEALAQKVLRKSEEKDPDKTHLKQLWAQSADTPYPVDNGTIAGEIIDQQACFNLNALYQTKQSGGQVIGRKGKSFARDTLLSLLKSIPDLPLEESEEALADSVLDWLDEDSITTRSGAEEDEYLSYDIPYLAANNLFADISELRLVKGFNPLVMQKLAPYVCVIPQSSLMALNVNTITEDQALLLAAMLEGVSESGAQAIIGARPDEGFDSVAEFINEAKKHGAKKLTEDDTHFVVKSEYFRLNTTATFIDFTFSMTSLLQVKDKKITILARKFGGMQ